MGWPWRSRQHRPILRKQARASRLREAKKSVTWASELVQDGRARDGDSDDLLRRRERSKRISGMLRLPALTYELFVIPLRVAFPSLTLRAELFIVFDVLVDVFEIGLISDRLRLEGEERQRLAQAGQLAGASFHEKYPYASRKGIVDALVILLFHVGRELAIFHSAYQVWYLSQTLRLVRLAELVAYLRDISVDLNTNVVFLATFKYGVIMLAAPHYVGCVWWVLSKQTSNFELPSWGAQLFLHSHNEVFDPQNNDEWMHYALAQYMAFSGVTAMGYGSIVVVHEAELAYAIGVCFIQVVFYAYVLGTLFTHLIRVDENTVLHRERVLEVANYAKARGLPLELRRAMEAEFNFQHAKSISRISQVNALLPSSLRSEVASKQYHERVAQAWVFRNRHPAMVARVVSLVKERWLLPSGAVILEGGVARELVWCAAGELIIRRGGREISRLDGRGVGRVTGEAAFFLGLQSPYAVSASPEGEARILSLSTRDMADVAKAFPEEHDAILTTVRTRFTSSGSGDGDGDGGGGESGGGETELADSIRQALHRRETQAATRVMAATATGDLATLQSLCERRADLAAPDADGRSPLHLAAAMGHVKVVDFLLEKGAPPGATDRWGKAPADSAASATIADLLFKAGAVHDRRTQGRKLGAAAAAGDEAAVVQLLQLSADVHARDLELRTPLHAAAAADHDRIASFLVARLADVDARDRWDRTPLDMAVARGPGGADNQPRTSTNAAERAGSVAPSIQVLRRAGAAYAGRAVDVCAAAARGDWLLLRAHLAAGADVDGVDFGGRTPLHLAVATGDVQGVMLLLQAGADVNKADRRGRTPLGDALHRDALHIAAVLARAGAELGSDTPQELASRLIAATALPAKEVREALRKAAQEALSTEAEQAAAEKAVSRASRQLGASARETLAKQRELAALLLGNAPAWFERVAITSDAEDEDEEGYLAGAEPKDRASAAKRSQRPLQLLRLLLKLPSAEKGLHRLCAAWEQVVARPCPSAGAQRDHLTPARCRTHRPSRTPAKSPTRRRRKKTKTRTT